MSDAPRQMEAASYLSQHHYRVLDLSEATDLHYYMYLRAAPRPWLDIGCSVGNLLSIDPDGSFGIDVDPLAVDVCIGRGLKAVYGDADQPLPFADASFGTLHCRHVIEHVWEPLRLMREMRRVTRAGGLLILSTPDFRYAYRTFYDDHTHLRPMTRESLRRLALDSGFDVIRTRHEVSRMGLRQMVRNRRISAATGQKLYTLAYRLGVRQRKTLVMLATAR
jgi:SAM-dependent methyltransferase